MAEWNQPPPLASHPAQRWTCPAPSPSPRERPACGTTSGVGGRGRGLVREAVSRHLSSLVPPTPPSKPVRSDREPTELPPVHASPASRYDTPMVHNRNGGRSGGQPPELPSTPHPRVDRYITPHGVSYSMARGPAGFARGQGHYQNGGGGGWPVRALSAAPPLRCQPPHLGMAVHKWGRRGACAQRRRQRGDVRAGKHEARRVQTGGGGEGAARATM